MQQRSLLPFKHLDYITVFIYLLLVVAGWFTIYAASYDLQSEKVFSITGRTGSQLLWMGITFVTIIILMIVDARFLVRISPYAYIVTILVLLLTILIAPDIKGSHSWLVITPTIRLQPAEFAKVFTAMMVAYWCSRYEFNMKNWKYLAVTLVLFLLPMLIIILQNETGSAIVFSVFFLVLYREGLTGIILLYGLFLALLFIFSILYADTVWGHTDAGELVAFLLVYISSWIATQRYLKPAYGTWVALGLLAVALLGGGIASLFMNPDFSLWVGGALLCYLLYLLGLFILVPLRKSILIVLFAVSSLGMHKGVEYFFENVLQPHQQVRILVTLGLKEDPQGAGYNVNQSLIAIGSGGLWGKGFLNGTQTKLKFVPEQDTDFILCTLGEEQGFIGTTLVLLLYLALVTRIVMLAERQPSAYNRIYGYAVACIFFFHVAINVGMVLGITPVIGIPLPFFSYGGSSFLSFSVLLFLLLRLDANRLESKEA